jgi:hypothetical protein
VGDSTVEIFGTMTVELEFFLNFKAPKADEEEVELKFAGGFAAGARANACAPSLCFVGMPPAEETAGRGSGRLRYVCIGVLGGIVGLDLKLPPLAAVIELKLVDGLGSGASRTSGFGLGCVAGALTSSDESTENNDDGESERGSSTAFSFPWMSSSAL